MLLLLLPLPPHAPCPFVRFNSCCTLFVGGAGSFFKSFAAAAASKFECAQSLSCTHTGSSMMTVVKKLVQLLDGTLVYPEHEYGDHT
jgi:hypothetical protein